MDPTSSDIIGRHSELALMARFVDNIPSGVSALTIEGEAGIGKTTLWQSGLERARKRGFRVLSCRPVEPEAQLSFAGLGDILVQAFPEVRSELPPPQRNALEVALLLVDSTASPPDRRAVSVAVLASLRLLADDCPVMLAVDDVQWLDPPSARVLSFALRRLENEPVGILTALRVAAGCEDALHLAHQLPDDRVTRLPVGALDRASLLDLLRRRLGPGRTGLSRPALHRLTESAGGNPFFALELARAVGGNGVQLDAEEPLAVPPTLAELLEARLSGVTPAARRSLGLASAMARPSPALVRAASDRPDEVSKHLARAERAGIIRTDGDRIRFTHPLLRSAVYSVRSQEDRRRDHGRLADVVEDPEERARHLALASRGPDRDVADALERAGWRARARGAQDAAAALFDLAWHSTPANDQAGIRRRRLRTAENLFDAGDVNRARSLVEKMLAVEPPGPAHAKLLFTLSNMNWNDTGRILALHEAALAEVGSEDRPLLARIQADHAWLWYTRGDLFKASEWAERAVREAEVLDEPFSLRTALGAHATFAFLQGRDRVDLLARALALEEDVWPTETGTPRSLLGLQLMWAGDLPAAREALLTEGLRLRNEGQETVRWELLSYLVELEARAGDWHAAARYAVEVTDLLKDAGLEEPRDQVLAATALVAALLGHIEAAREQALEGLRLSERHGHRVAEIQNRSVLGFLALSIGDPAAALELLGPLPVLVEAMGVREPGAFPFIPDLVEALVALGDPETAKALAGQLEGLGRTRHRALALATAERCHGLVAAALVDVPGALLHLQRSVDQHEPLSQPFELGRTLLIAGGVQRRSKQKRPARATLERALGIFETLGASLWAAKARSELARIGGRAPSPLELTPTEQQVAALVAAGRTNREVAEGLFMSVHTVDANLKRIYRKLSVRSRTELANRLAERLRS
ncbi:MAG TPA: AAA family ATPase [Actinomycetota bacterium]|nr:AAA family ATPase [Actinomycetota bacterium]